MNQGCKPYNQTRDKAAAGELRFIVGAAALQRKNEDENSS
jgi:hypothetical protein